MNHSKIKTRTIQSNEHMNWTDTSQAKYCKKKIITWRNFQHIYISGNANQTIRRLHLSTVRMITPWNQIRNSGANWEQGILGRLLELVYS
jgi:hypothetical protein